MNPKTEEQKKIIGDKVKALLDELGVTEYVMALKVPDNTGAVIFMGNGGRKWSLRSIKTLFEATMNDDFIVK